MAATTAKLSASQRSYLDFIRAAAAMLVLVGHSTHFFLGQSRLADQGQGFGVLLFFLISGFLIGFSVLQRSADQDYGFAQYFIDRFCRIYCAYLPALLLVLTVDGLVVGNPLYEWSGNYNARTWLGNLIMLQEFPVFQILRRLGMPEKAWFLQSFGTGRPFWTISIEWWIYMTFGMTVLVWRRRHWRFGLIGGIVLGLVAIEPLYHFVGGYDSCLSMLWVIGLMASAAFLSFPQFTPSLTQLDWNHFHRMCLIVGGASVAAMAARLFGNHFNVAELQFGVFLAAAVFALLFAFGGWRRAIPRQLERVCAFLAGYSYSLYLTHYTVIEFLNVKFPGHRHDPHFFWLAILSSNVVAIAFWWLFERHHRHIARLAKSWLAKYKHRILETPQPLASAPHSQA